MYCYLLRKIERCWRSKCFDYLFTEVLQLNKTSQQKVPIRITYSDLFLFHHLITRWRWFTRDGTGETLLFFVTFNTPFRFVKKSTHQRLKYFFKAIFVIISSLSISAIAIDRVIVICFLSINNWSTRWALTRIIQFSSI